MCNGWLLRENLEWTHKEVNYLKHELFGHRPSHAKACDVDQLLRMMERQEEYAKQKIIYGPIDPEQEG